MIRRVGWSCLVVPFLWLATSADLAAEPTAGAPPNVVLIMADDLGYGDLGCYNAKSKVPTPNIDRLAVEGMRFTDAHAPASVCVPTRYALLTGRYPFRMSRTRRGSLIEADRPTMGSTLRSRGYVTACVGKWHLGFDNAPPKDSGIRLRGGPTDRGFDYYFGIPASLDIPPYYFIENGHAVEPPSASIGANYSDVDGWTRIQGAFWRAGGVAPGFRHADVLPEFTGKAVGFLRKQGKARRDDAAGRKPFFLYLALAAPHTPWLPSKAFIGKTKAGMYGDFTAEVDASVGRVLATLDEIGVRDETLVVFTSDNGPVWYAKDVERFGHSSVGALRGMKGDAWEGGHRMPFLVRWPGRVKAGVTFDQTICHTDLFATFASIAGVKLAADAAEDSFDLSPALLGKKTDGPIRGAVVHQSSRRVLAVRHGKWKLIPALGSGGFSKPSRQKPTKDGPKGQLYDMSVDASETRNIWQDHPEVVERLTALLERYRRDGRSRPGGS